MKLLFFVLNIFNPSLSDTFALDKKLRKAVRKLIKLVK